MKVLVLWLLTSSALAAGSPLSSGGTAGIAGPLQLPAGAHPAGNVHTYKVVHEAGESDGVNAPADEPTVSSESSEEEEEEEEEEWTEDEDIDASSIFAALFEGGADSDGEQTNREGRFAAVDDSLSFSDTKNSTPPPEEEVRAVSDPSTIAKYNHFIDVFFRRVNSELSAKGDPMEISLSKKGNKALKGGKGRKKKGKDKKGNKSKKNKRNPRDFNYEGVNRTLESSPEAADSDEEFEEESPESDEDFDAGQTVEFASSHAFDDDSDEFDDEAGDVAEGGRRQGKDLELKEDEEAGGGVGAQREGRGLGMERRRAEAKRMKINRGNGPKNAQQRKNRSKRGKKGKRRRRKGGKNRPGGNRRRKNKGNRGRSRDSIEESDPLSAQRSQLADLGMDARKRKDEAQDKRSNKGSAGNDRRRKNKNKTKKNKRGKKNKVNTVASVSGFSSLMRQGDVNVTQSSSTQKISSHFALGPVSVLLSRQHEDGQVRTAVSTAVLSGVVVVQVNRSGRAAVTRLKISKPSSIVTEGSLRAGEGKNKRGNKPEKIIKTSIKRVSPQIIKQIEATAHAVLDSTSRAVSS